MATRLLTVKSLVLSLSVLILSMDRLKAEDGVYWSELGVTTDEDVHLLLPFQGFVGNGKLCGLIGPSGSGKSTFLAAISRTTSLRVSGEARIVNGDGTAITAEPSM